MKKRILITAATSMELEFLLKQSVEKDGFRIFENENTEFTLLVSGIGSALSAYSLSRMLQKKSFDAAVQIGIAGSFHEKYPIGSLVKIRSDVFADICLSDNGKPIHEASFDDFRTWPFTDGKLIPDLQNFSHIRLPEASAITVNSVTAGSDKRLFWLQRYNPDVESMEGAAFYYACMKENIPGLQIRAVSNFVGYSNTKNWDVTLAIKKLTDFTLEELKQL